MNETPVEPSAFQKLYNEELAAARVRVQENNARLVESTKDLEALEKAQRSWAFILDHITNGEAIDRILLGQLGAINSSLDEIIKEQALLRKAVFGTIVNVKKKDFDLPEAQSDTGH